MTQDIFDRIPALDIFDEIELPIEEKVAYSSEMTMVLRDEIRKEIGKIPIGKILAKLLAKQLETQIEAIKNLKSFVSKEIKDSKADSGKELLKVKAELVEMIEKLKKKFTDLRTDLANQPQYTFGGFSPQTNDLNIGDPSIEGAWRVVKNGVDLEFQRFESGVWTVKGSVTP